MSAAGDNTSSPTITEESLLQYTTQKLKGSIFSGVYVERRWIEDVQGYRDKLTVDDQELDMIKHLRSVHRKIKKQYGFKDFCGIEKSDAECSLFLDWNKSELQYPFGHYWFMIEDVSIREGILHCRIKVIRPFSSRDLTPTSGTSSRKCPHCGKCPDQASQDDPLSVAEIFDDLRHRCGDFFRPGEWYRDARPYLTFSNLVQAFKFTAVLLLATVSGASNLLINGWSMLNRTIHELGTLIQKSMPFFMGLLTLANRAIGGFYLLLTMMWRDVRKPGPPPQPSPQQRLAMQRQSYLEGPKYPYMRRDVQRPYFGTNAPS